MPGHHECVTSDPLNPPTVPGYLLGELLGRGATSRVWAGLDGRTGQAVAVKVTAPERLHVGELMELAARETAILATVDHDHVVRLHEAIPLPDGSVAVVLDLARGGDLGSLVAARGRLDPGEVVTICTPLAEALAALHRAGVVHADLAPGNVVLTADGRALLTDFESARLVGESLPPTVAGTPGFVAPEVHDGELPEEAADVYALGGLIWFALTGRAFDPAAGPGPGAAEAEALVGPEFANVVARLLALDPADRPGAAEAAVLVFEAAPARPVRLVPSTQAVDPDRVLTHRIRSSFAAAGQPSTAPVDTRRTVAARRRLLTRRRQRRVASWAAVVVLIGVAVPGVLRWTSAAGATGPGATVTGAASPTGWPTEPADVPSGVASDVDPGVLLAALVDARAQALSRGSELDLAAAVAVGSPQHGGDLALLGDLQRSGRRFSGLGFEVTDAQWVLGQSDPRIRAVVRRSAYQVLGPGSEVQSVAADPGRPLVYRLVGVAGSWRIAGVSE